jgi:hypothetical protein
LPILTNRLDKNHESKILNFSKWYPITAINGGYKPSWIAGKTNGTGNYAKNK